MRTAVLWAALVGADLALAGSFCEDALGGARASRELYKPALRHLDETEQLLQKIVRQYPMSTHEYVFVGRSPTLLAALSEVQKVFFKDLRAWILPVSLKNSSEVGFADLSRRFEMVFETYRGSARTGTPKRTLVFIDAVATGRTFLTLDRLVSVSKRPSALVGLTNDVVTSDRLLKAGAAQTPYTLLGISDAYMYDLGHQKIFAPFASHDIESVSYRFGAPQAGGLGMDSGIFFEGLLQAIKAEIGL